MTYFLDKVLVKRSFWLGEMLVNKYFSPNNLICLPTFLYNFKCYMGLLKTNCVWTTFYSHLSLGIYSGTWMIWSSGDNLTILCHQKFKIQKIQIESRKLVQRVRHRKRLCLLCKNKMLNKAQVHYYIQYTNTILMKLLSQRKSEFYYTN